MFLFISFCNQLLNHYSRIFLVFKLLVLNIPFQQYRRCLPEHTRIVISDTLLPAKVCPGHIISSVIGLYPLFTSSRVHTDFIYCKFADNQSTRHNSVYLIEVQVFYQNNKLGHLYIKRNLILFLKVKCLNRKNFHHCISRFKFFC
jgi:hypothetical protein